MSTKNGIKLILIVFLVYCSVGMIHFYRKVVHETDPEAKCLDGSSPMIYLHEGGDTEHILFYFLGGGSCADKDLNSTLENCYQRSKGEFGTSTYWPTFFPSINFGMLEVDPANKFANWTKIVVMYCDGAFHQGNNKSPIKYKDTQLYFRGAVNTRSHFKWADNKYGLGKAKKIVLSGSSAGGMATFLWIEYLKSLVPDPKVVYGIADSAIFYEPMVPVRRAANSSA